MKRRQGNTFSEGESETEPEPILRRSTQINLGVPPKRFLPGVSVCATAREPQSYEEVLMLSQAEKTKWLAAMDQELDVIGRQKVFEKVQSPLHCKPIGCRWVYRIKSSATGSPQYKACLVAMGCSPRDSEYDQIFAPTVRPQSIRMCLAIAARKE